MSAWCVGALRVQQRKVSSLSILILPDYSHLLPPDSLLVLTIVCSLADLSCSVVMFCVTVVVELSDGHLFFDTVRFRLQTG